MSAFTGERLTRDGATADLWAEHVARYAFAATFAPAARALDVGCGTGYGSARLSHVCGGVTALDVSAETVAAAAGTYRLLPNLRFLAGAGESLPFPAAAFDLVTAFEVIEHIADWPRALDELSRVLAPGGVALVSTPNRAYYTVSRGDAGPNPFHVHEFDHQEFRDELQRRFSSVSMLLQNWTQCLAFYPHRVFPPATCDIETTAGEPEQAHFFLAVCSHAAPPDLRSYVHVPRGANLLREREMHIASLEGQLEQVRGELSGLIRAHEELNAHLDSQNRWGLELSAELDKLRLAHSELQSHSSEELEKARSAYAEVYSDMEAKTRWALSLSDELDAARTRIVDLQNEFEKEQQAAQRLADALVEAQRVLAMTRESRWVRLGRSFGVGPDLQG